MDTAQVKNRCQHVLEAFQKELSSIRTGQARVDLVEDISVNAYGMPTPLQHLAAINVPEPRMILISPWDSSLIHEIEKALMQASHLGLTPTVDKNGIRLNIPPLTEERRKNLAKEANKKAEEFRIEIRQIRDDVRSDLKDQLKNKEISEDEQNDQLQQLDELTKEFIKKIDDLYKEKEQEITQV